MKRNLVMLALVLLIALSSFGFTGYQPQNGWQQPPQHQYWTNYTYVSWHLVPMYGDKDFRYWDFRNHRFVDFHFRYFRGFDHDKDVRFDCRPGYGQPDVSRISWDPHHTKWQIPCRRD